ncbi:MAG: hypothetical protein J0M21_09995 [Xanthomonadales bacterium]|nr:hypothetical protein [Xanthomonadales bacterium]
MSKTIRGARRGRIPRRPRIMSVTSAQFRELREFTGKTREDVSDFLGVSVRTVGNWETGAARVPYAAYKLLRVVLKGDTLHPGWEAYRFVRGRLVTPEGHSFGQGDLAWLSLLVQRANFASLTGLASRVQAQVNGEAVSLGLVTSATSQKVARDLYTHRIHPATFSPDEPGASPPVGPGSNTGQKAQGQQGERHGGSAERAHFGVVEGRGGQLRGQHRGQPERLGCGSTSGLSGSEALARRAGAGAGGRSPCRAGRGACVGTSSGAARSQGRRKSAVSMRQSEALQAVPRRGVKSGGAA